MYKSHFKCIVNIKSIQIQWIFHIYMYIILILHVHVNVQVIDAGFLCESETALSTVLFVLVCSSFYTEESIYFYF